MHTFLIAQNTFFFLFSSALKTKRNRIGLATFTGMVSELADDSLQGEKLRFLLWEPFRVRSTDFQ